MKRVLAYFFLLFLISISTQYKAIAYSSDPEKFIAEIVEEAKIILNSKDSQETKAKKLSQIAIKTVDIKGLASYTLGKKRKEISSEELKKYQPSQQLLFQIDQLLLFQR